MKSIRDQKGFALLMLMVVLLGFVSFGIAGLLNSSVDQKAQKDKEKNIKILSDAKELLLDYAIDYSVRDIGPGGGPDGNLDLYRMGHLPCPDVSSVDPAEEGNQEANCGGRYKNSIGLLPFKTLSSGRIIDSANECLWYVVSGEYKNWVSSEMLNWDTVGYLNLVDKDGVLKHGASEDDFPIAFIISPGSSLDQTRSPDGTLLSCRGNHTKTDYLEGGPNIDYSDPLDLPDTADTVWNMLTTSEQARLENSNFNDQVIAIYKSEWWNRVEQLGQLDTDDTTAVDTLAETVTQQLANCLSNYGNDSDNLDKTLPFAAPVDLSDYRNSDLYNDSNGLLAGRFPEKINNSEAPGNGSLENIISNDSHFVSVQCALYESAFGDNEVFWDNWKDHFFYYVGQDFKPGTGTAINDRCDEDKHCLTFDGHDKLAAVVFFAGPAKSGQTRIWTASVDNKKERSNYLEGNNDFSYNGSANTNFVPQDSDHNDYAFCVKFSKVSGLFSTEKCRDLP